MPIIAPISLHHILTNPTISLSRSHDNAKCDSVCKFISFIIEYGLAAAWNQYWNVDSIGEDVKAFRDTLEKAEKSSRETGFKTAEIIFKFQGERYRLVDSKAYDHGVDLEDTLPPPAMYLEKIPPYWVSDGVWHQENLLFVYDDLTFDKLFEVATKRFWIARKQS